jgi:hypothetical protein
LPVDYDKAEKLALLLSPLDMERLGKKFRQSRKNSTLIPVLSCIGCWSRFSCNFFRAFELDCPHFCLK